jgi:hypothetical protein
LSDLTSNRQGPDESVKDYIRRFRDIKNQCFNFTISEKDMDDLAVNGLHSYLREKLDGHTFITLSLSLNSNKKLRYKKVEVKKIKIILSILVAMLIMSIVILIALAMRLMLLNFAGLPRPNLMLVIISSQFIKMGKKKLNLLLM